MDVFFVAYRCSKCGKRVDNEIKKKKMRRAQAAGADEKILYNNTNKKKMRRAQAVGADEKILYSKSNSSCQQIYLRLSYIKKCGYRMLPTDIFGTLSDSHQTNYTHVRVEIHGKIPQFGPHLDFRGYKLKLNITITRE